MASFLMAMLLSLMALPEVLLLSGNHLFSVLAGCHAFQPFKKSIKHGFTIKTHFVIDVGNGFGIWAFVGQQFFSGGDPMTVYILIEIQLIGLLNS